MARATTQYTQQSGTLALYKSTYQPISGILNTALPRTADTGQVNWGTIATEPTTVRDFEIFSLGGPLAGTAPIFMRFDYRGGTLGGVYFTAGTTTDGAGTLGGLTVPQQQLQTHALTSQATPALTAWAASDGESYLTFAYALDVATTGPDGVGIIVIERTRNADGTANGTGFLVWRFYANSAVLTLYNGVYTRVYGAGSQTGVQDWNPSVFVPDVWNLGSAFKGTTSYGFPAFTYAGFVPGGASQALMYGYPNDFPRGTPITVTHYGQQMSFIPMGDSVQIKVPAMTTGYNLADMKNLAPLIRWD